MIDVILDTLLDALKTLPFVFLIYLLIEFLLKKTNNRFMSKMGGKKGPIFGSLLGAIPQCSLSMIASTFFSYRVITLGTLISVFLSTSDEAFILLLAHPDRFLDLLIIFSSKIIIGMVAGFLIDLIMRKSQVIEDINEYEIVYGCDCGSNIFITALKKTVKIMIYILIASFIVNTIVYFIGEDNIASFLTKHRYLEIVLAPIIGLIPSCAPSIILTELFLSNSISYAGIIGGLLTNAGVGTLVLFRYNKNLKQNIVILAILLGIGIAVGCIVSLVQVLIL